MGNIIVLVILGVIVFFAARNIWKNHKNGSSCNGNCGGCGGCSGCH